MPETSNRVFPSAIDRWLIALVLAGPVIAMAVGATMMWQERPGDASIMFLIGAVSILLTLLFMMPCRYTLTDDCLNIRCGILFYRIDYDDIVGVSPSSTLLSGPALSLRRVEIKTKRRKHIVSPQERDAFMTELRARIPAAPEG